MAEKLTACLHRRRIIANQQALARWKRGLVGLQRLKACKAGLEGVFQTCSDRKMGIEAWPSFALAATDLLAKLHVALPARGDQPACRRWVRWSLRRRDQLAAERPH